MCIVLVKDDTSTEPHKRRTFYTYEPVFSRKTRPFYKQRGDATCQNDVPTGRMFTRPSVSNITIEVLAQAHQGRRCVRPLPSSIGVERGQRSIKDMCARKPRGSKKGHSD